MSRKKRIPWNKGLSKFNNSSIAKISKTLSNKPRSNFYLWQLENCKKYAIFDKNEKLAELIGVILGDGHIERFPRTERLIISSNSNNEGFIKRYSKIVELLFNKKPLLMKSCDKNCVRISIYEKFISKRLGIPCGSRKNFNAVIPKWILKDRKQVLAYLRGLYEAEGSFSVHKPTSTYKLFFSNKNGSLLNNVFYLLELLGLHPHKSQYKIQLSRKKEVETLKSWIKFRDY
jgi:DNA-binding transcriptional regulator WhiA